MTKARTNQVVAFIRDANGSHADEAYARLMAGFEAWCAFGRDLPAKGRKGGTKPYLVDVAIPAALRSDDEALVAYARGMSDADVTREARILGQAVRVMHFLHDKARKAVAKERNVNPGKVPTEDVIRHLVGTSDAPRKGFTALVEQVREPRKPKGESTSVRLERDAYRMLEEVMNALKADGKGSTASDAIRYLKARAMRPDGRPDEKAREAKADADRNGRTNSRTGNVTSIQG